MLIMRINRSNQMSSVYKMKKKYKSYATVASTPSKDTVTFSETAKDVQMATKLVKKMPDVRIDKVDALKNQIEAGKYNVTANQIADKLLGGYH